MKTAALLLLLAATAAAPTVAERDGNIEYTGADGTSRTLTRGGGYEEPALSPDGRTVAYIHIDKAPDDIGMDGRASLWIADGIAGTSRKLLSGSGKDEAPERNLNFVHNPVFSLDGGFVYVSAQAWVTSDAVHQINLKTGTERFVSDGSLLSVVRTGPYRGYLLIQRHKYYTGGQGGSYNPIYVMRPDGKKGFMIKGSERDDGEESLGAWLEQGGWKAW